MVNDGIIEADYPKDFRKDDVRALADHLKHRHSVELVGMRRVGISNFLRFFLCRQFLKSQDFYISVDLNDLVERKIFGFWRLVFKRLVDKLETSVLPKNISQKISRLFLECIQSNDLFLTVDGLRQSLGLITQSGFQPTLFLIRFDRLKEVVTPEFFDNLKGLKEAANQQLAYVFTSFRPLHQLAPLIFTKPQLVVFSHQLYLKPADFGDALIILNTFKNKYKLKISSKEIETFIQLSGGHVQYLQLMLIICHEQEQQGLSVNVQNLLPIINDERLLLQSEELFESLSEKEKEILIKILNREKLDLNQKRQASYLWDTGMLNKRDEIFSPLLAGYLQSIGRIISFKKEISLTKKENQLFEVLKNKKGEICEREEIIEKVWPEYQEIGVSDWAIDRLVARLRKKLALIDKNLKIKTIKTRGFRLEK